jgi:hypothetical protein
MEQVADCGCEKMILSPRVFGPLLVATAFLVTADLAKAESQTSAEPSSGATAPQPSESEAVAAERSTADEASPARTGGRERRPNRFTGADRPDRSRDEARRPVDAGFLFVDGEFLSPPYVIRTEQGKLLVNDRELSTEVDPQSPSPQRTRNGSGMQADELYSILASGNVVCSFAGQPLLVLVRHDAGLSLLRQLVGQETADVSKFDDFLLPGFDAAVFREWHQNFRATPELRSRTLALIEQFEETEERTRREIAAVRRSDTLVYLVTVFGMVLAVAASGHLLSMKPPGSVEPHEPTPEMVKMVSRSLGLVVLLSSLDLFWTIMASQAGRMVELNPLGSHLLHDPMQLIAAKAAITCMSVGLLYFLRYHRQAQVAAWWACLILTLLTFRWLTFNSMFMS